MYLFGAFCVKKMFLLCIYGVLFMLPQDMKRCSVCTLRKSDKHFIRKERIWKTCNECSKCCQQLLKSHTYISHIRISLRHLVVSNQFTIRHPSQNINK